MVEVSGVLSHSGMQKSRIQIPLDPDMAGMRQEVTIAQTFIFSQHAAGGRGWKKSLPPRPCHSASGVGEILMGHIRAWISGDGRMPTGYSLSVDRGGWRKGRRRFSGRKRRRKILWWLQRLLEPFDQVQASLRSETGQVVDRQGQLLFPRYPLKRRAYHLDIVVKAAV